MDKLQRIILVGGLALILSGFVFGIFYSLSVDRSSLLQIKDSYSSVFIGLSSSQAQNLSLYNKSADESPVLKQLDQLKERTVRYSRAIGAHAHAINLGLLVIFIGLLLSVIDVKPTLVRALAILFLSGAVIYPIGLSLQAIGYLLAGEVLAVLGSGSLVVAMVFLLWALFFRNQNSPS